MANKILYSSTYICEIKRSENPITTKILKFGGSPIFHEEIEWPKCQTCGQELDFLAQIPLDTPIQFSSQYATAYIFMCPGKFDDKGWLMCPTWQPNAGANHVILQKKKEHSILHFHNSEYPDYIVNLQYVEEPQIDTSDFRLSDEILEAIHPETKLGGVPFWLQNNETPKCPKCGSDMKFVSQLQAQLNGDFPADGILPSDWESKYKKFNFGGCGIAYMFLCKNECSSEGSFLWQCD